MPKISVIIPSFNAEKYIGNTISSVLQQTYTDFEIVVVDDASTDGTKEVVHHFMADERVKLLSVSKNFGGPAGPKNIGVSNAKGDWICFLDADDIWHRDKLATQINALTETNYNFCCSSKCNFSNDDHYDRSAIFEQSSGFEVIRLRDICSKNWIPNSSVMISKELLGQLPFNEEIAYHAVEDYDCWLRVLERTDGCLLIDHPLIGYRVGGAQISKNKLKMAIKFFMVLSKHKNSEGVALTFSKYGFFLQYVLFSLIGGRKKFQKLIIGD